MISEGDSGMGDRAVIDDEDEDQLLTLEQVAARFQLTTRTIRNLVSKGELRAKRVGRRVFRFKPAWIEEYLDGLQPQRRRR
jgi:excisionase family DNA binding protein